MLDHDRRSVEGREQYNNDRSGGEDGDDDNGSDNEPLTLKDRQEVRTNGTFQRRFRCMHACMQLLPCLSSPSPLFWSSWSDCNGLMFSRCLPRDANQNVIVDSQ